jgi:4-hydroxy-tetrahydrodipicolinate synthase
MDGVWTALVTPFDEAGELDLASFGKTLGRQAASGISGVVVGGSTGESVCLKPEERRQLVETALKELKGSGLKVFAGTGSSSTRESVEYSIWANKAGVDGIMVVTPYYNKPSQEGLYHHFYAVADAVTCQVMIYNVPSRTAVSLTAETLSRLAQHPRITSLKEATGCATFMSEVIELFRKNKASLDILSGDDLTFLPMLSIGAVGVVSVASNLIPKEMVAIQKAYSTGQVEEAKRLHQFYYPLFRDLFVESNPVPVKYALSILGTCKDKVREPLAPLLQSSKEKIEASLRKCHIL